MTIHADASRTKPGSRRYIHAKDVADGLLFILGLPKDYKHEGVFLNPENDIEISLRRFWRGQVPEV